MKRISLLAALRSDCQGTSVVELALCMPVAAFLLAGTVNFGMGFTQYLSLEQAATRTVQQAIVQGPGLDDYAYLRQAAADASGLTLEAVTLDKWLECDGVRQLASVDVCAGTATPARFVSISITKSITSSFDLSRFTSMFTNTVVTPSSVRGSARMRIG